MYVHKCVGMDMSVWLFVHVQWVLVYQTTFVPHKMCWINQVLDKSG